MWSWIKELFFSEFQMATSWYMSILVTSEIPWNRIWHSGDFNCTVNKMERDGRNKILYRCHFNYALPKFIVDNGLEDLWRTGNPDSSEFTYHDRSCGTRSRIERVYTDIKIISNTKINHTMVSFTEHYNSSFIDRFPSKTKVGKDSWYFNDYLLCKLEVSLTTKTLKMSELARGNRTFSENLIRY